MVVCKRTNNCAKPSQTHHISISFLFLSFLFPITCHCLRRTSLKEEWRREDKRNNDWNCNERQYYGTKGANMWKKEENILLLEQVTGWQDQSTMLHTFIYKISRTRKEKGGHEDTTERVHVYSYCFSCFLQFFAELFSPSTNTILAAHGRNNNVPFLCSLAENVHLCRSTMNINLYFELGKQAWAKNTYYEQQLQKLITTAYNKRK